MVMARLHLICGNCGCNDEWEYYYEGEIVDRPTQEKIQDEDVKLCCRNCATIHSLNDNAEPKN